MGLAQGKPAPVDGWQQVVTQKRTGVVVLDRQPPYIRAVFRQGIGPGSLRRLDPLQQAALAQRPLQGAHGQDGIAVGGHQRQPHVQRDERAVGIDAVGLGQGPQRFLRLALPQQQHAQVERRIDEGPAATLMGGTERRLGQVHAAIAQVAKPLPESGRRRAGLNLQQAGQQRLGRLVVRWARRELPQYLGQHRLDDPRGTRPPSGAGSRRRQRNGAGRLHIPWP